MNTKLYYNPDDASNYQAVFLEDGQAFLRTSNHWQALQAEPKDLIDVAIAFHTWIYGLDAQGNIWEWEGNRWEKDPVAKNVVCLTSNDVGLWCVTKDGKIWVKTALSPHSTWTKVDEDIHAGNGTAVWEYTVKAGDWLWKIVRDEYKTSINHLRTASIVEEVKILNPSITNWNSLQPGIKLKMPAKTS